MPRLTTCTGNDVTFTICFEWPEADVDVVLSEIGSPFQPTRTVPNTATPKSNTVDQALHQMLCRNKELWNSLKVECSATNALIMGVASVEFRTDLENFSPELVEKVRKASHQIMAKHVQYYKKNHKVRPGITLEVCRR